MIRIAICDDDIGNLEYCYRLASEYATAHSEREFFLRRFQSAYDMVECLESRASNFHVYILDILMPMLNGIELGAEIRKNDAHAVIVYLTSSPDFALESFKTSPANYLVKPVTREVLFDTLDRVCGQLQDTTKGYILLRTKDGMINVRLHQIIYAEYARHAITLHLVDGRSLTSMVLRESFTSLANKYLSDPRFIRPHSSFIVNMDHVWALTPASFELADGLTIPISKRVLSQVRRQYMDYLTSKNEVSIL